MNENPYKVSYDEKPKQKRFDSNDLLITISVITLIDTLVLQYFLEYIAIYYQVKAIAFFVLWIIIQSNE